MHELVDRARRYATEAHSRINHRRKYSLDPYDVHLKDVAGIVATVTDDPEIIAAAWLHDVVEDTPASFLDVEREFGPALAALVEELTDVSRPADGNRATRKAMDRAHLARASSRAKTVKLADLIDNCRDICRQDPEFARVFLTEMASLLEVLGDGDQRLHKRASAMLREHAAKLDVNVSVVAVRPAAEGPGNEGLATLRKVSGLFQNTFSAMDIAHSLPSVDGPSSQASAALMEREGLHVLGIRRDGQVSGYVLREDPLSERAFRHGQVVGDDACFSEIIMALSQHSQCFVRVLGTVCGVVVREDLQHPYVRMWLFGIITMMEMQVAALIEQLWPGDAWTGLVSEGRLAKARSMLEERVRRGQQSSLLSCLQLADKMQILFESKAVLDVLGFPSRNSAAKVCKEFESLRNNLAHAQDIVAHDFAQIARLALRIESLRELEEAP
jgi:hypothetical protein